MDHIVTITFKDTVPIPELRGVTTIAEKFGTSERPGHVGHPVYHLFHTFCASIEHLLGDKAWEAHQRADSLHVCGCDVVVTDQPARCGQ